MTLHRELKMNANFSSEEQEAHLSLARTIHVLDPLFSSVFASAKITSPQYNVLRILNGNKSSAGMSCADIGSRMITRDSDLTRLVDKLVKAEFVLRERPEHDRRKVLVNITAKGKTLVKDLTPKLEASEKKALGHMSSDELQQLTALLSRVRSPHLS